MTRVKADVLLNERLAGTEKTKIAVAMARRLEVTERAFLSIQIPRSGTADAGRARNMKLYIV